MKDKDCFNSFRDSLPAFTGDQKPFDDEQQDEKPFSLAVPSLKIIQFLEDSSPIRHCLGRLLAPIRPYADSIAVFGCGFAALCLCVLA